MIQTGQGQCLHCDGPGVVGELCSTPSCARRGFAFVPMSAVGPSHLALADPMLGLRIDDWLLTDLLGAGGFGRVYLALQVPILLKAALKLLSRVEQRFLEKFQGEAIALAQLSHPNIVRLLKFGHFRTAPYIVMEYAEGRSLAAELDDPASRVHELETAGHIVRQIANALAAAHAAEIIHRDIKPGNIVIQPVPGDPAFARVLDFGIAKFVSETSDTSVAMGTPIYMAPETVTRSNIGPWTDIYSLGVLAFELVFNAPPYADDLARQLVMGDIVGLPDPLTGRRESLPPAAVSFFERALAREPERRLRSAAAFRSAWDDAVSALGEMPPQRLRALRVEYGTTTGHGVAGDTVSEEPRQVDAERPAALPRPVLPPFAAAVTRPARRLVPWWTVGAMLVLGAIVAVVIGVGGGAGPAASHTAASEDAASPADTATTETVAATSAATGAADAGAEVVADVNAEVTATAPDAALTLEPADDAGEGLDTAQAPLADPDPVTRTEDVATARPTTRPKPTDDVGGSAPRMEDAPVAVPPIPDTSSAPEATSPPPKPDPEPYIFVE